MNLARLIASGFGVGFIWIAPGTAAAAVAWLLGALLMLVSAYALPLAVLIASFGGVWAIRAARVEGDPGWVVIDEFAGQWLAMLGLVRASVPGLITAFVIFRVLDIAKPGPIAWADRQGGAAGIMADDLIAGAITAGILWAIRSRWPELLG